MNKNKITISKKTQKILFASLFSLVLLLAFIVRILYVWKKGFWYDEILTMRFDVPKASKISFNQIRFLNDYIIYQLKPYWNNEFIIRLPNLIASGLCVAVLGLWLKRALGKIFAIAAMICLAISPCFIQHTCLCRAYGLLAFFILLNCWSAYEITAREKISWYLLFVFSALGVLITRMEGIVIPAALAAVLPFMILFKEKITRKKILISGIVIIVILFCGWFGGKIIYKKALTFSMSAMGTLPDKIPFNEFIVKAGKGILKEISWENFVFSLHQNFRADNFNFLISVLMLIGLFYLFVKNSRMAVVSLILIIFAFPLTKWLLESFYKVPFDSRHMQHATPAFIILFISGLYFFIEITGYIKPKIKFLGYIIFICGVAFYIKTAGAATAELIKYNRIADWKQIALLSKRNNENIFINGGGRGIEFGYYKPRFTRGNLNTCFSKLNEREKVYYFAGNKRNEAAVLKIKNRDVIAIPFEPFSVFVIYENQSNYWKRLKTEMEFALSVAPRHARIIEQINAAKIMLSEKSLPIIKQINNESDDVTLTADDWQPLTGFDKIEKLNGEKFRWSNGKTCALIIPKYERKLWRITLTGLPFYDEKIGGQKISLYLGETCLGTKKISGGKQKILFDVPMNFSIGERRIALLFGNPVSPAAIGKGGDPRTLALGISEIKLSFLKEIPDGTLFIADEKSERFLGESWSNPEKWQDGKMFRWIDGKTAEVALITEKNTQAEKWEIEALPFVVECKQQKMSIEKDGCILTNFTMQNCWAKYAVTIPPLSNGFCKLKLIFDYAIKPKSIGKGGDTRALSAAVSYIKRIGGEK